MIVRSLVLLAAVTAMASRAVATQVQPPDRHVLHHCEDVLTQAANPANTMKARPAAAEVDRCRIVVREFALRDSRMSVDENGKMMR